MLMGTEPEERPSGGVRRVQNARPNFQDPQWIDKVDDWDEFWGSTAVTEREVEELEELDAMRDEIALALGKKAHDKRATIKERDWQRQRSRLLNRT